MGTVVAKVRSSLLFTCRFTRETFISRLAGNSCRQAQKHTNTRSQITLTFCSHIDEVLNFSRACTQMQLCPTTLQGIILSQNCALIHITGGFCLNYIFFLQSVQHLLQLQVHCLIIVYSSACWLTCSPIKSLRHHLWTSYRDVSIVVKLSHAKCRDCLSFIWATWLLWIIFQFVCHKEENATVLIKHKLWNAGSSIVTFLGGSFWNYHVQKMIFTNEKYFTLLQSGSTGKKRKKNFLLFLVLVLKVRNIFSALAFIPYSA